MDQFVDVVRRRGGSDLHLKAGRMALMRVGRLLEPMRETIDASMISSFVESLSLEDRETLDSVGAVTSIVPALGIRAHVYREGGGYRLHMRMLDQEAPRHERLGRPQSVLNWVTRTGLILVTGPHRAGKSTQVAAFTGKVLDAGHRTALEIGRPPEFRYAEGESFVAKIHVGRESPTFGSAIREALNGDLDVIIVQQVDDADSAEALFKAMEAGGLVIAALHANDTLQAIDRLCGYFPRDVANARHRLANALIGVMNLRLVMDKKNVTLPATEVLAMNETTRAQLIAGEMLALRQTMAASAVSGMQTLEQDLSRLVRSGAVSRTEAIAVANYPDEVAEV